jgi:hypothetical protein
MKLIQKIDVSKHLANHLVGEHHTIKHRRMFGGFMIVMGTIVGGLVRDIIHLPFFHTFLDYTLMPSIHCLGAIPFLSQLENKNENNQNSEK